MSQEEKNAATPASGAVAPYTKADPSLAPGTRHAGFTVTDVLPLPELAGTAYVMRHDATGARAMWIAVDDNEKSFSIAFKTPPANSTGVFHILEHSVLCGSNRFPVKEPFVNLLKTSMQTFLNALTFPDKTMYPVASTNAADLKNLVDVYLDAVLHPAIYRRPRIFEQEGWHLELQDADGNAAAPTDPGAHLAYNGVVFNEMKGALSDPDEVLFEAVNQSLFPDTPYRFESGGDPRHIPELSYEEFLDTHARHYNLANSYTILYGNLDIEDMLAFVGSRFDAATDRGAGAPNPLPLQAPVRAPFRQVTMATAPENASVGLAYVIGCAADRERVLATDVLLDALAGSNEAPLKRAVLDADLGDDFTATLVDGELQPQVLFQLKGAKPGVARRFRQLVEDTCARLAADGIDRTKLEASLAQGEFNLREGDWGSYADGVALSMQAMSSWLYDDARPVDYLRYEDEMAHMRAGLGNGYFERLLRELVCDSPHSCEVELVPAEEGAGAAEKDELLARQRAMTPEDLAAVAREVEALRREQEAPDSPEALATLPRLTTADIGPAPTDAPLQRMDAPLPCLYHDLPTHRIDYAYLYFDLGALDFADLPYVGVLTDLLGKLDTADHTASELDTLIEANLGNLDFFAETYGHDDDLAFADPKLVVAESALSENVAALATIAPEVWSRTSFADADRMLAILTQRRILLAQHFVNSGHSSAMAQLTGLYSKVSVATNAMGGVEYYLFLKDLLAHWDERKADNVHVSFTGPREDCERFWKEAGTLGLASAPDAAATRRLLIPEPRPRNLFFSIPSNVCFVAEGMAPSALDRGTVGAWTVASRMLSFDYLWNEVRVKGGAYGAAVLVVPRPGSRRHAQALRGRGGLDGRLVRHGGRARRLCRERRRQPRRPREVPLDRPQAGRRVLLGQARHVARRGARPGACRHGGRRARACAVHAPACGLAADHAVVVFGPRQKAAESGLDFEVVDLMDPQPADAADEPGE